MAAGETLLGKGKEKALLVLAKVERQEEQVTYITTILKNKMLSRSHLDFFFEKKTELEFRNKKTDLNTSFFFFKKNADLELNVRKLATLGVAVDFIKKMSYSLFIGNDLNIAGANKKKLPNIFLLGNGGVLEDDFVERFSKTIIDPNKRGGTQKAQGDSDKPKEAVLRELRVIRETNQIVGREAALKKLPNPDELVHAIKELESHIISKDMLHIIKENAVPTPEQLKEMDDLRVKHPDVPWALPEKYMFAIGHIPAYQARIDAWYFCETYEERVEICETRYDSFLVIIESFKNSVHIQPMLAFILACGNYLNGGQAQRGQADGFELEALTKLESVKDNLVKGENVMHWMFKKFLKELPDFENTREPLIADLAPLLVD